MKNILYLFLVLATVSLISCSTAKKTTETAKAESIEKVKSSGTSNTQMIPDPPGVISFKAANDRYSADGTFKSWRFKDARMKGQEITTLSAEIEIDLNSIWEKSDRLTNHLKAPDYFDVAKYNKATLKIANVRQERGGKGYIADMSLSMRDKVQKMTSKFEVTSKMPLKVKGSAMIDRGLFLIGVENTGVENMIEVTYNTIVPMK